MSSDMMLICKEDNSGFGSDYEKYEPIKEALFIDECSMGCPLHAFGEWFAERFCKAPSMMEQLAGVKEHNFMELTLEDVASVKLALLARETHKNLDKSALIKYMKTHVGKHVSTENW